MVEFDHHIMKNNNSPSTLMLSNIELLIINTITNAMSILQDEYTKHWIR